MTAFRCTAKLLKAMKKSPEADPAPASNRLANGRPHWCEWGAFSWCWR
jgi:hypothetical protein